MIQKKGSKYYVYSEEGRKLSRGYSDKSKAEKRLHEIEYFKKKGGK